MSERAQPAIRELVVANRILGNEAWSMPSATSASAIRRMPAAISWRVRGPPGLVTEDDIIEFDLDSNRLDSTSRAIYTERFIHGCLYKARPGVMSVCHPRPRGGTVHGDQHADRADLGDGVGQRTQRAELGYPRRIPE
jgi:HCOMODA/2-hydroxy-3-carboxy-muconic semialdehyde decarboxylase